MKTNICDACETVAYCSSNGCVGYSVLNDIAVKYPTDWEAVAADQAMTIALLQAEIDRLVEIERSMK